MIYVAILICSFLSAILATYSQMYLGIDAFITIYFIGLTIFGFGSIMVIAFLDYMASKFNGANPDG